MTTNHVLPIGVAVLPDGALACQVCGMTTTGEVEQFRIYSREQDGRVHDVNGTIDLGLCETCRDRSDQADALATEHLPGLVRWIGGESIVRDRVHRAFDSLAVLGVPMPTPDLKPEAVGSLLSRMSELAPRWAGRYSPMWTEGVSKAECASEPFLWISAEHRDDLRAAYKEHLRDRMPPRAWPCPSGGCAWCGLSSVEAIRDPWREWSAVGTPFAAPGVLRGHLCPLCARTRDEEGSDGLGTVTTAYVAFLDEPHQHPAVRLKAIHPWITLDRKPSTTPWRWRNHDRGRAVLRRETTGQRSYRE